MRLLSVDTYDLHEFVGRDIPPYAILSHRWEKEEVTFRNLQEGRARNMLGWQKLEGCCHRARLDNHAWVWIDTCCIDKSSSAELSEAINSMFKWYEESEVCYTYLSDVSKEDYLADRSSPTPSNQTLFQAIGLAKSRWFTRGWTLQELIAPHRMLFYDRQWKELGTRNRMSATIQKVTGVNPWDWNDNPQGLTTRQPGHYKIRSAAQRMSWASRRETSRGEDMAYCLLGLFDVNMPLLYGEGIEKAFYRLQLEILQKSDDESLFAWDFNDRDAPGGLLATRLSNFANCSDIVRHHMFDRQHYLMTNKGLHIELSLAMSFTRSPSGTWPISTAIIAPLNCSRVAPGRLSTSHVYICLGKYMDDRHKSEKARCFSYDAERYDKHLPSPAARYDIYIHERKDKQPDSWKVYVPQRIVHPSQSWLHTYPYPQLFPVVNGTTVIKRSDKASSPTGEL